jgi:hypothetical protein
MMTKQVHSIVVFSDRLYRLLLWLYPVDHRREYGPLMAQVFRDQCRTAYMRDGASGVLWMWFPLVVDLAVTLIEEHRRKGFSMSKDSFTRFSGPLLMLGGLAWALSSYSQFQPGSQYVYWGIYRIAISMVAPGFLLTGVGLIGVQVRYGAQIGRVQVVLVSAILGAVVAAIGMIIITFVNDESIWWNATVIGYSLYAISLLLFGITALRSGISLKGGWLPILIAVIGLSNMSYSISAYNAGNITNSEIPTFAMLLVTGLAWIAFGYSVYADRPQPQTARA